MRAQLLRLANTLGRVTILDQDASVAADRPSIKLEQRQPRREAFLFWLAEDIWSSPLGAGLAAAAGYTLLMILFGQNGLGHGPSPYFSYLADGFLHGQLAATPMPFDALDLINYRGQLYLYWPPFPALLFLPLVAAFGPGVSDAPLSIAMGCLNVGLVSWLLSTLDHLGVIELPRDKRAWLTAFFAFGTVQVAVAPHPHAAYFTQLVGFGFLIAAYLAALRLHGARAALLAGILAACAFLSRNPVLLSGFWIAWYLIREQKGRRPEDLLRIVMLGLLPIGVAVVLLGLYNFLRFGSLFDAGLAYLNWNAFVQEDVARYGAFSLHYLSTNLFYTFVFFPYLALFGQNAGHQFWMGGSLFLMSPVFLLALSGVARAWRPYGWALLASWLAGLLPALFWVSTGRVEFGPRLTLDVSVPLLMLAAMGASAVSTRLVARLSLASFVIYLPGTILLGVYWW